jgi:hypothetical protein
VNSSRGASASGPARGSSGGPPRGSSSGQARASGPPALTGGELAVAAAAYVALFLVGALLGLIGTFQYGRGPVPLAAILFDAAILASCVLGSWGMRTALGGVLPAAGWFIVTLLLTSTSPGGSVIVTDTPAGKWFLFGGAVCAAAGAVFAFARWSRSRREHRGS